MHHSTRRNVRHVKSLDYRWNRCHHPGCCLWRSRPCADCYQCAAADIRARTNGYSNERTSADCYQCAAADIRARANGYSNERTSADCNQYTAADIHTRANGYPDERTVADCYQCADIRASRTGHYPLELRDGTQCVFVACGIGRHSLYWFARWFPVRGGCDHRRPALDI